MLYTIHLLTTILQNINFNKFNYAISNFRNLQLVSLSYLLRVHLVL
jgi:hypothetical protein